MFSKNNRDRAVADAAPKTPQKSAPPTIISADLRIVGDLTSEGELHIDGIVDGDIRGKSVLVGESANIKGEIIADVLTIHGTVSGQIKAGSVTLAKTAHVTGDILHENLAIQQGAFLEGHCKRINLAKETGDGKINLVAANAASGQPAAQDKDADAKKGAAVPPKIATQAT